MSDDTEDIREALTKDAAVELSGRTFQPYASFSFEQDLYLVNLANEAGLMKFGDAVPEVQENWEKFGEQLVMTAFKSGNLFLLLGGTYQEGDNPWSIERSMAQAKFFAGLSDKEDKERLSKAIVSVLFSFFTSGVLASMTSEKSSQETETQKEDAEPSTESSEKKTEQPVGSATGMK